MRHLTNRGIGVLITDHNVRETLGLTDRAYIIYSGEVLMEGRADDIVNNPEVRRLYLGEEFRHVSAELSRSRHRCLELRQLCSARCRHALFHEPYSHVQTDDRKTSG